MPEEATRSFQIGDVQCIVVNDGNFSYPASWFFSNVPQDRLEDELRLHGLQPDQVLSPYACLLIKAGNHKKSADHGERHDVFLSGLKGIGGASPSVPGCCSARAYPSLIMA